MEQHLFKHTQEFELESGESLPRFQLLYCTWGELNEAKDNIIWICHALTGNAEADDWWEGLIGEGKKYDTSKYFIICANMLGSCYGSTSPLDINPITQSHYLLDFPMYTVRDVAHSFDLLRKELGFEKVHSLVGGSMGGMVALEWAILQQDVFEHLILLATNAKNSPYGIAFNETQRMAIMADKTWKDHSPEAGKEGLKAARAIALLSYRNYEAYWNTQSETDIEKTDHYKASSYQKYQGEKLISRFNCQSYWFLSKAMDSHHLGRGRKSLENALQMIHSKTLVIGVTSDMLFPPSEQKYLSEHIPNAIYEEIDSFYGHDGFLIETKAITEIITDFYASK
ncbi:MAG: homoserine O-acetyltransferase [Cytophagales bacterium]|nr:homoserine O-acetyltransferase [Cytophagales bacterium]